jgi:CBS domain-containing protein
VQARDVMTAEVVTVGPDTSAKHAGELMAGHGVAALPVVDGGHRLVGMVAEADVLRTLVRPDRRIRSDVLRLVEACTDDLGSWDVRVTEGVTTVRRTQWAPEVPSRVEEFALERLVRTVPGVVAVHVLPAVPQSAAGARS